jgi:hypothetical protein
MENFLFAIIYLALEPKGEILFLTDGTIHELDTKKPIPEVSTEAPSECHYPSQLCNNKTLCLPVDWLCDGKSDCEDGFDEGLRCGK